jgi:hypothetical protein
MNPSVSLSDDQEPQRVQTPIAALPALRDLVWAWSLSSTLNHIWSSFLVVVVDAGALEFGAELGAEVAGAGVVVLVGSAV